MKLGRCRKERPNRFGIIVDDESLDEKERWLGQSLIFKALDAETRKELTTFARTQRVKAGEPIFRTGTTGHSMIAIAEGSVRISMTTPTLREIVLAELAAGEVLGEIALLDGGPRSADAHALTNCKLIVLDRREFLQVLTRNPALAVSLIELLCSRLRRSDERMMEIAFLDLPSRLAKTLLRLTASGAMPRSSARLSLSQTEIANMIGSSRENVNRCLRKWQERKLIDLKDGWLTVLNRKGLEAIALFE